MYTLFEQSNKRRGKRVGGDEEWRLLYGYELHDLRRRNWLLQVFVLWQLAPILWQAKIDWHSIISANDNAGLGVRQVGDDDRIHHCDILSVIGELECDNETV